MPRTSANAGSQRPPVPRAEARASEDASVLLTWRRRSPAPRFLLSSSSFTIATIICFPLISLVNTTSPLHFTLVVSTTLTDPVFSAPDRYSEPYRRYVEAQLDVPNRTYTERTYDREGRVVAGQPSDFEATLDETERRFRQDTTPFDPVYAEHRFGKAFTAGQTPDLPVRTHAGEVQVNTTSRTTVDASRFQPGAATVRVEEKSTRTTVDPVKHKRDMGYYDDEGQYHSFRRGVQRVAERIAHPIHGPSLRHHHHHHSSQADNSRTQVEEISIREREYTSNNNNNAGSSSAPRDSIASVDMSASRSSSRGAATVTIPCHHIRIGDLLMLQGRPCQVIRITTSSATGQHRYLGVDLFTKQLHEESSFISTPSPSVVVQQMLGPVFKQYRVLDIRDDGRVVAMTEGGDIKQGLAVLDQSNLIDRLADHFDNGRGSVRVLVLNDGAQELAVDFKVVHGSRL